MNSKKARLMAHAYELILSWPEPDAGDRAYLAISDPWAAAMRADQFEAGAS